MCAIHNDPPVCAIHIFSVNFALVHCGDVDRCACCASCSRALLLYITPCPYFRLSKSKSCLLRRFVLVEAYPGAVRLPANPKVKACAAPRRAASPGTHVRIASRPSAPSQDPRTLALEKPPMLDISRVRHRPWPILRVRNHPPRARFPRLPPITVAAHDKAPRQGPSSGACSAVCTGTG